VRASIVIATRERADYLARCLAALRRQSVPADEFEVIVVDDASRTPVSVEATAGGPATRLIRLSAQAGPSGARNAGIGAAASDVIAFTDDDCRPDERWLESGLAELDRGFDLVAGRTLPEPEEDSARGPFDYSMSVPGPDPRYSTCNMFYRRDVLERSGGFTASFASASGYHLGEDTDLAWRVIEAGARAGYTDDALVYHAVRPQTFAEHLRSRRRLENLVPLVKRHPAVKSAHFASHVYSVTHLFVALGLVGIALAPWSAWTLGLLAPWAAWRSREKRSLFVAPWRFLDRNRHLAHWFVADAYELWIFLRASVRHRHLYV
jgi:GT2 family glycosyltransferase